MKGIILAGGAGSRLYPATKTISKQLLPIYDKPLIYYPLSVLMLAGITDILIITSPNDLSDFEALLGSGSNFGINLSYKTQEKPRGIAEAFIIGENFINNQSVCLMLGDNIFYGDGLSQHLNKYTELTQGAAIFGYYVSDPERYGVANIDKQGKLISLEEKPKNPKSNYAVPGLYFYDNQVVNLAKQLKPSLRGELEITDINKIYLEQNKLELEIMGRGIAWLDTGTPQAMQDASRFVEVIETRQGLKIACLEEIAYRMNLINSQNFIKLADNYPNCQYGEYLRNIAQRELIS
jgi:glucose-1-phosphate thymidylyltransferase